MTNEFKTMADVRAANRANGKYFFAASSMRFFNSKVESALYAGRYFITSERFNWDSPKKYTIREVTPDADIETIGDFQQFRRIDDARQAIRDLVKSNKQTEVK